MVPVEVEFKFEEYLTKFARGEVVKNACLVLKDYAANSSAVNHAVIKLLHRLCVDMKLAGLTHQVDQLLEECSLVHTGSFQFASPSSVCVSSRKACCCPSSHEQAAALYPLDSHQEC